MGVIRTNCMDCMDRSNVVQKFYGLKVGVDKCNIYTMGAPPLIDAAEAAARI